MDDATALRTAARLIDAGQEASALQYVGRVLAHDPGDPLARLYEVMALEKVDPGRSRTSAESLVADHPEWVQAWVQLTYVLAHHFTPAEAASAAGRTLQLDPGNVQVHLSMSDSLFRVKDFQGSLDAVERGLALGNRSWQAEARRGYCLFKLGRQAEGLQIVRRVVGEHPDEPEAAKGLAVLEGEAGNHETAVRLANRAAAEAMGQNGTGLVARTILTNSLNRLVWTWVGCGLALSILWGQIWRTAPGHSLVEAVLATGVVIAGQILGWRRLSRGQTRRTVLTTVRRSGATALLMILSLFLYAQPVYSAAWWRVDRAYHSSTPVFVIVILVMAASGVLGRWLRSLRARRPQPPSGSR